MSIESEYFARQKKRKEEEELERIRNAIENSVANNSVAEDDLSARGQSASGPVFDIGPVRPLAQKTGTDRDPGKAKEKSGGFFDGWFKGGAFSDGEWNALDLTKTILGTFNDVQEKTFEAVSVATENLIDSGAELVGQIGGWFGNKDFEEKMYKWANGTDLFHSEQVAKTVSNIVNWTNLRGIASNLVLGNGITKSNAEDYSVLGEKSGGLVQSAADMIGAQALKAIPGVGPTVATAAMFNNAYRAEMRNAYQNGATVDEAQWSAVVSGGAEVILEGLGGLKIWNKLGLDKPVKRTIAKFISSKAWRTALSYLTGIGFEAGEEIATELFSRIGQNLTYMDNENFWEYVFTSQDAWQSYLDAAIGGAVMGMAGGAPSVVKSVKTGRDLATELTANEEAVVKKVYETELAEAQKTGEKVKKEALWDSIVERMKRGELSIDTIEEVLGGEDYTAYRDLIDKENSDLQELAELFEGEDLKRETEDYLKNSKRGELYSKMGQNVFDKAKGDRLVNAYVEVGNRVKKFEADVSQYADEYARKTVQNIIDSGAANNTRRMHDLADLMAKISADKHIVFSVTDAKKLAETSLGIEGKIIDGFVTEAGDEITINLDSPKYLNRIVGHEVTHILEGTEFYDTFRKIVETYAKDSGEYKARLKDAWSRYKNVDRYKGVAGFAKIKKEVVADLVGDYIFSDSEFVKTLSVKNRNIFEKIYDEIKYLCKVATAGSEQEKQLLKVKKAFEDAYRADTSKVKTDANGVIYSLSSIGNAFFGDPNMSAEQFKNADYAKTQGYKDYLAQCVNNVKQSQYTVAEDSQIERELGKQIKGIIDVAIAAKEAGYDIFDDPKKISAKDSKNRLLFSSLEPNSDYFTSNDISSICDKRKSFAEIYDEIVRQEEAKGVPVGKRFFDNVDNYFAIHKIMADKGLTTPCRQCYVESMRKNLAPMAKSFLQLVNETDPNNKFNDQLYHTKGKKKGELKTGNADTRTHTLDALEEYGMSAENLTVEMLTTAEGLATLKISAPKVYEQFNSFYGQSKPKMPRGATPFRPGELTALLTDHNGKINKTLVNKINSTGGFRLQSYSDFQIENFVDTLQVLFEAGTLGLRGHSYTKVPAFLDATEGTNLKRNISIFMYKDGNEWKLDRNDSFPYSIEEIYDIVKGDSTGNTGIVAVSQNEDMSCWIMANDNIGYFIPFHKSGIKMDTVRDTNVVTEDGRTIKGYSGIKDHTRQQSEVWAFANADHKVGTKVKKPINIYLFWDFKNADNLSKNELIEKNVKAYIDACEEAGYLPKFRALVANNRGILNKTLQYAKELGTVPQDATIADISFKHKGYTIPYGYYKCLGDFGMFTPDGRASSQEILSLKDYDFNKAVEFFQDSEALHREEILQQFANGEERQKYRDSNLTAEQLTKIVNQKRTDVAKDVIDNRYAMAMSLSEEGATPVNHSQAEISGEDVRLQTTENYAPVVESAQTNANNMQINNNVVQNPLPDNLAPSAEQLANNQQGENISPIADAPAPAESEATRSEQTTNVDAPKNPFAKRDYTKVGSTKTKSFVEENPDAKPFFQEAARSMLEDLQNSTKGSLWYNDNLYHESGGESGMGTVKRSTTEDIAYLLDGQYHYSYQQIAEALDSIINDEPLNACAKRIEFALNDRLMNGYTDVFGNTVPPNQAYINMINQVSTEVPDDIAPPVAAERGKVAQIRAADKQDKGSFWQRTKKAFNDVISLFGDKGWAIENLSRKIGDTDRELQASYDKMRNRSEGMAQARLETELMPIMEKAEATGNRALFDEYAFTLHHIDRMSLDSAEDVALRAELRKELEGYTMQQIERIASETIGRKTPQERVDLIFKAQQYVDLGGDKGKNKTVLGDVTKEEAIQRGKEIETEHPEFKAIEDEVVAFNRGLLQDAVDAGLLTQKNADLWMELYPHYVPVVRHGKNGNSVSVPLHANKTGVNSPFKRATGGNSDMLTLFEAMARNVENITFATNRNEFGHKLFEALEAAKKIDANALISKKQRETINQGGLKEGQKVVVQDRDNIGTIEGFDPKTGKYSVYFENARGYYATVDFDANLVTPIGVWDDSAIDGNEEVAPENILDNAEEDPQNTKGSVVSPAQNGQPPQFTIFVKGKRVTFDITPEIYDSMVQNESVKKLTDNPFVEAINKVGKARRAMLTKYDPFFALARNPIRDTLDVLTNSRHAFRTYLTGATKTHAEFITKGKYYREYVKNGGMQNSVYDRHKMSFKKDGKVAKAGKAIVKPYDTLSDVIEQYWRLSEYIASREQGKSVEVALLDSARVTTNFGAGGDVTKAIDRAGGMFINPSVQGVMQNVRNIREAYVKGDVKASVKNYAILSAKLVGMGVIPMIIANLAWGDDEDYEELSDYVKQNYHIVGKTSDGKFIRIPKGRMQAVMQNAFEQMVDAVKGEDEIDFEEFGEIVANNLGVNNPLENNLFSPIKQAFGSGDAGKTWYGEDLVPTRLQDLPAAEQYDESTDEISKFIGKVTNTSPYKWNYLLDQYGAGVADIILPMLTEEAEGENFFAPIRDEFVTDPLMKNQNVSDFYTLRDELTVKANASTATDTDFLKSRYMNSINAELSSLYAQKREIQNASHLSDDNKYAKVRAIQEQIVKLAREALQSYDDVKIQGSYATVGDLQYRYYVPGKDSKAEAGWKKLSEEEIKEQNEVTSGLGISASEYWSNKEEYDYAYKKPEKYAVARVVGGFQTFRELTSEIDDIEADKDSSGRSISGTKKRKVIDYIDGLDLDYGEKIILFKSEYSSDDTYDNDIINYLNSRRDLSYKDIETILRGLGFTVDKNGNIY